MLILSQETCRRTKSSRNSLEKTMGMYRLRRGRGWVRGVPRSVCAARKIQQTNI